MQTLEKERITKCIRAIEQRYFKEIVQNGGKLKQRDLEYLIELMEEQSNTRISLSTLKRLWKNEFTKAPHLSTLNALVSLLDYENWRAFQDQNRGSQKGIHGIELDEKYPKARIYLSALLVGLALFAIIAFWNNDRATSFYIPENIEFRANNTVVKSVPNSVIFSYNLKDAVADSFFIQRSWNPSNKTRIDPTKQHFSEIYYYPGFHWARLIANDQVIGKTRIHVKSDGWFATAKHDRMEPIPTYLNQADLIQDGTLKVSPENFEKSGFDPDEGVILSYHNIKAFEGVDKGEFILETSIKFEEERSICPYFELRIIDELDASTVGLTDKGCVSNSRFKFGETLLLGTENDFSSCGLDVFQWQTVKLKIQNQVLRLYINESLKLETPFEGQLAKIMGLIFTFTAPASVDFIRLMDLEGNLIYSDEFDS